MSEVSNYPRQDITKQRHIVELKNLLIAFTALAAVNTFFDLYCLFALLTSVFWAEEAIPWSKIVFTSSIINLVLCCIPWASLARRSGYERRMAAIGITMTFLLSVAFLGCIPLWVAVNTAWNSLDQAKNSNS